MNKITIKDSMNFGKLGETYDLGRYEYPIDVIDYIFSLISSSPKLLDVGCGTGIATRQLLSKIKNVSGCDIDERMIKVAKSYEDQINYYTIPTHKMFFNKETFDVLTAFGAFHWFCDNKSVKEICGVLKKRRNFYCG